MMDGILHNIARKRRSKDQQVQRKRTNEQSPGSPHLDQLQIEKPTEITPTSDESNQRLSSPRKGILKFPTVHFPEDLNAPNEPESRPSLTSSHSFPGASGIPHTSALPPPPPPPPPVRLPSPPPPPPYQTPLPPALFDKAIERDKYLNEAAYKLYTKFIDDLSDFVDQQGAVIRTRLHVQEKRQQLKQLRESVSQCDMLLIDYIRVCVTTQRPSDNRKLLALFNAAQAARDLFGPLEAEYEPLEVNLGAEESKLKNQYAQIESRFEQFFRLNANPSSHQSISSKIQYEDSLEPSVSGEKEHAPEIFQDLGLFQGAIIGAEVSVGQVPIAANAGKLKAIPETNSMERPHLAYCPDTQDPIKRNRSNETMEEKTNDELPEELLGVAGTEDTEMIHSHDIESRDRMISRTLEGVSTHSLFDSFTDLGPLPDEFSQEIDLLGGNSLLLLDESSDTQSILSDYLITFESTRDRVNRWMLHHLRLSPREVHALRRRVSDCSPGVPDWAVLALSEWPHDELGAQQSYHHGSVENDSENRAYFRDPGRPYPDTEPVSTRRSIPRKAGAASLSNVAIAPTASDLHNRTLSSRQDFTDTNLATTAALMIG
ncbi:hypothetical protein GQ44DRAFT_69824 [Phaeosphaeriaceae sp. PMI808]|nr:hypothetical protein GQ44DRAFT_69824 [Phaeosphaeriaceae sp. PMI808]